jgi:hypothetical protein
MTARATAVLAWTLGALTLVLTAAEVVLVWVNGHPETGDFLPGWAEMLDSIAYLAFPIVGMLIALRRPSNPIGWLILGASVIVASTEFAGQYAVYALVTNPNSIPGGGFMSWFWDVAWIFPLAGLPLLFLLFPTGSLLTRRWRFVAYAAAVPALIMAGPVAIAVWPHRGRRLLLDPESVEIANTEDPIGIALVTLLVVFVVSVVSLFLRYKRSGTTERRQLQWLVLAGLVMLVDTIASDIVIPGNTVGESLLSTATITFVPVAIGIAILKHGLYDIDRIINRTIVYGLVTAVLAGGYALCVVGISSVIGRPARDVPLLVAASTLAMAAAFRPLRKRVQNAVDLRFYRRKYNAERTVAAFGDRLRQQTDLNVLRDDLLSTVNTTIQPERATLWLAGRDR